MSRKGIYIRLTNNSKDKVIQQWLENAGADPDINISKIVKRYLYRVALGQDRPNQTAAIIEAIRVEFSKLPRLMIQGGAVEEQAGPGDDADRIEDALASMPD